jgi:hypothetical protein
MWSIISVALIPAVVNVLMSVVCSSAVWAQAPWQVPSSAPWTAVGATRNNDRSQQRIFSPDGSVRVAEHYAALFSAALRIFGSWPNALIAAGIEVPDRPHGGPRRVLRALRNALEQHSKDDLPEKLNSMLRITSVAWMRRKLL